MRDYSAQVKNKAMILWGAFIEKNRLSEDEILQSLGYLTKEIIYEDVGFISANKHIPNSSMPQTEIFTGTTKKGYMILIDNNFSKIGKSFKQEREMAKYFRNNNVYKFLYDCHTTAEAFSHIVNGKLKRAIYRSSDDGKYEFGKRSELEPDASAFYSTKNLFGKNDNVIIEKHDPFKIIHKVIENMLTLVTGKRYSADFPGIQEIKLNKRLIRN